MNRDARQRNFLRPDDPNQHLPIRIGDVEVLVRNLAEGRRWSIALCTERAVSFRHIGTRRHVEALEAFLREPSITAPGIDHRLEGLGAKSDMGKEDLPIFDRLHISVAVNAIDFTSTDNGSEVSLTGRYGVVLGKRDNMRRYGQGTGILESLGGITRQPEPGFSRDECRK